MYATDFCNGLSLENLDYSVSSFNSGLLNIYAEPCPVRTKSLSVKPRKPWLTDDILKLIQFKQFLYNDYKKGYIPFYIYNNFKNRVCKVTKKAKDRYMRGKFQDCIGNSAKTSQNINVFFHSDANKLI